jgi:hypothetical protein
MYAHAIDKEHEQGKDNPLLKLGHLGDIVKSVAHV